MSERTTIFTPDAPAPIGPYSQAIKVGTMLFCSGQIPLDPKTGELKNDSIETETRQVIMNMKAVLLAAGGDLANIVKTTIFLTDLGDFAKVNAIYEEYFGSSKPARSTIEVKALPKGAHIEIECIAQL
jgi:2-iminobutanoate/2-iminopropanoate deaminase